MQNCQFPLFVTEGALNKEKDHVEGFAAEVRIFSKPAEPTTCPTKASWLTTACTGFASSHLPQMVQPLSISCCTAGSLGDEGWFQ